MIQYTFNLYGYSLRNVSYADLPMTPVSFRTESKDGMVNVYIEFEEALTDQQHQYMITLLNQHVSDQQIEPLRLVACVFDDHMIESSEFTRCFTFVWDGISEAPVGLSGVSFCDSPYSIRIVDVDSPEILANKMLEVKGRWTIRYRLKRPCVMEMHVRANAKLTISGLQLCYPVISQS